MKKKLIRLTKKLLFVGLIIFCLFIIYILNAWKFSLSGQEVNELITEINQTEELPIRFYDIYNLEFNNALDKNLIQSQFNLPIPIRSASLSTSNDYLFENSKRYHKNHLLTAHSLAIKLENNTTQKQCLNWIVNRYEFGYGNTGLDSASTYFFKKKLSELNDRELATLVVMLRNSSLYNPIRRKKRVDRHVDLLMQKITMANNAYN